MKLLARVFVLMLLAVTSYADSFFMDDSTVDGEPLLEAYVVSEYHQSTKDFEESLSRFATASDEEIGAILSRLAEQYNYIMILDTPKADEAMIALKIAEQLDMSKRRHLIDSENGFMASATVEIRIDSSTPFEIRETVGVYGGLTDIGLSNDNDRLLRRFATANMVTITIYDDSGVPIEHSFDFSQLHNEIRRMIGE